MSNNQKLELTWIGKDIQPKLEPRILIEAPDKSYGDRSTENMLILGDKLLALNVLEQEYTGPWGIWRGRGSLREMREL